VSDPFEITWHGTWGLVSVTNEVIQIDLETAAIVPGGAVRVRVRDEDGQDCDATFNAWAFVELGHAIAERLTLDGIERAPDDPHGVTEVESEDGPYWFHPRPR